MVGRYLIVVRRGDWFHCHSRTHPMDITYKIIAADGKEYGPVKTEQLHGWIREGRIAPDTQLLRSDIHEWRPASSYPELNLPALNPTPPAIPTPTAASPTPGVAMSPDMMELEKRVKSGGSWFYWVAGLSLVNSVMAFSGSGGGFVIGLSVTQVIDAMLSGSGANAKVIGLVLGLLAVGIFALCGVFACKRHVWAFLVGMGLYALDTLLTVVAQQWLGVAFHAWVLVSLFLGVRAALQANALTSAN